MLFSVIVPIYNVEEYLDGCIRSVLRQTCGDFELILVIDGSPDNSAAICRRYAEKDSRIRIIEKERGGLVSARKAGANAASGDYIVCLDGDDQLAKTLLARFRDAAAAYGYPDLIACGFDRCEKHGEIHRPFKLNAGYYTGSAFDEVKLDFLGRKAGRGFPWSIWGKAYRRRIYVPNQNRVPDNIRLGEDLLLCTYVLHDARSMAVIGFCGYRYNRMNADSLTHMVLKEDIRAAARLRKLLLDADIFPRGAVENHYYHALCRLGRQTAKAAPSYRAYREEFADLVHIPPESADYRFRSIPLKAWIKILLIRHRMWHLLWLIGRCFR